MKLIATRSLAVLLEREGAAGGHRDHRAEVADHADVQDAVLRRRGSRSGTSARCRARSPRPCRAAGRRGGRAAPRAPGAAAVGRRRSRSRGRCAPDRGRPRGSRPRSRCSVQSASPGPSARPAGTVVASLPTSLYHFETRPVSSRDSKRASKSRVELHEGVAAESFDGVRCHGFRTWSDGAVRAQRRRVGRERLETAPGSTNVTRARGLRSASRDVCGWGSGGRA